jgi:hypothetical protein
LTVVPVRHVQPYQPRTVAVKVELPLTMHEALKAFDAVAALEVVGTARPRAATAASESARRFFMAYS